MKRFLLFTLFVLGLFASALAQERVVTGKVTDAANEPMPGVAVIQKGTTKGTVTDLTGAFRLPVVGDKAVLVFKMVGFRTQEVAVGSQTAFTVSMQEDATELKEVVVTALGTTVEKDRLGSSSSTVKGQAVARSGEATLINGLSGKTSGVNIVRSSGDPGAGSYIQIRGQSTVTGNLQPLKSSRLFELLKEDDHKS